MGLIALGEANWRDEEIGSRRLVRKWTRRAFVTRIGTEAVGMKQKGTGPGQRQGFGSGGRRVNMDRFQIQAQALVVL